MNSTEREALKMSGDPQEPEEKGCHCSCHAEPPEGWNSKVCCPDCGSTLCGLDEKGMVIL